MSNENALEVKLLLTPEAVNQTKLRIEGDNRFVIGPHAGQALFWTVDQNAPPESGIKRWVVAFVEKGTPGRHDGSPLSMEKGGEPVYQVRDEQEDVTTYVVGEDRHEYRFAVAVEGQDGTL